MSENGTYMARRLRNGPLADIFGKVEAGVRLSLEDGLRLYRSEDINGVGWMANLTRERLHGGVGIMADDAAAGLVSAAILLAVLNW